MDECRLTPVEVCLERIFMLDYYDGIAEGIALEASGSIFVFKRMMEVDVFELTQCFLYAYHVRVLDDSSLVELIRANSRSNEYVNLYGSSPWFQPILESESFRAEHWLAFGIELGKQTVYRVDNCSGG